MLPTPQSSTRRAPSARAIGDRLASALKQPVLVENKPGAGMLVGAEMVAKAPDRLLTLLAAAVVVPAALYAAVWLRDRLRQS